MLFYKLNADGNHALDLSSASGALFKAMYLRAEPQRPGCLSVKSYGCVKAVRIE